jgi:hypothetical protein
MMAILAVLWSLTWVLWVVDLLLWQMQQLQRSLPSLVPVVLHTVASPEEHRQRFRVAKETIASFRQQLRAALQGQQRNILFEKATPALQGDLHYIFDAIDRDRSGFLSTQELATHLHQAGKVFSEG